MSSTTAPTVLEAQRLAGLAQVAQWLAAQPGTWQQLVRRGERGRWYVPLARTDQWEAWLLGWPRQSGLELHDHGGAAGAVHVLAGRLCETWWNRGVALTIGGEPPHFRRGRLNQRVLRQGDTVVFGPNHIHDVRGLSRRHQALSIHVYAPRLTSITFYGQAAGELQSLYTQPQPAFVLPEGADLP